MGKFSRCGFEFQERRGPLRGADVVRAVHAARAYSNRGQRSFHSFTPGCELSPLQGCSVIYLLRFVIMGPSF